MEKFHWASSDERSLEDLLNDVIALFLAEQFIHTECFTVKDDSSEEFNCVAYDEEAEIQTGFEERFLALLAFEPLLGEEIVTEGGKGSGNFKHAGRPGKEGGSKAGTGGAGHEVSTQEVDVTKSAKSIYIDLWTGQDQKAERMILITKDGLAIIVGSGEGGQVGFSAKEIDTILKDHKVGYADLKYVVHNHEKGEPPSDADLSYAVFLRASGFKGNSDIYNPNTGQVQTILKGKIESLEEEKQELLGELQELISEAEATPLRHRHGIGHPSPLAPTHLVEKLRALQKRFLGE